LDTLRLLLEDIACEHRERIASATTRDAKRINSGATWRAATGLRGQSAKLSARSRAAERGVDVATERAGSSACVQ
jgi:hypothetical protein